MKRIGILFGQERSFPQALVERINRDGGDVVAEPVKVGGICLDSPKRYDLILDRISQDIPFYRAILKKAVADGTVVVNNPFWWTADDKFFNNVLAKASASRSRRRSSCPQPASARHDLRVDVEPRVPARLGRDLLAHRLPRVLQALLGRRLEERLPGHRTPRSSSPRTASPARTS